MRGPVTPHVTNNIPCDYAMCSIVYLWLSHDAGHQLKPGARKQNIYACTDRILPKKVSDWRIRSHFLFGLSGDPNQIIELLRDGVLGGPN